MNQTLLETPDDLQWLRDTHLASIDPLPPFVIAILHGNEDCPQRIDLYAINDFRCTPTEYALTDAGYVYARGPMPERS